LQQFKPQLNSLAMALSSMNDTLNFSMQDIYYNMSKYNNVFIELFCR
jgi:hypothetical protein